MCSSNDHVTEKTDYISQNENKVSDSASVSFEDDYSLFGASEFQKVEEQRIDETEICHSEEPRISEAERKAFFAQMTVNAPEFKPTIKVLEPTAED